MRFVRYQQDDKPVQYGWIYADQVGPIEGTPFGEYRRLEVDTSIQSVRLLSPVIPGKIICVGRNYVEHAREHHADVPQIPLLFMKPSSSCIGLNDEIIHPPQTKQMEHEAELAVVIGKSGRWIAAERALDYVLGYSIANDVTARDLQRLDGQWTRAKSFDTFCPLGPWIETDFDPSDALITCRVNDELRQMASTREMVFTVSQLIAFASTVMTLDPGDVLLTGTPAGVGVLSPGDKVQIEIEGIGTLSNSVILETSHL
ncbi:MAG: fumarylacetoacetate hydrolase family protein [Anaerolineaceae bacterium]|nr:fumarylacetoacetate hydrolase family protein [Anaerolineaceae bacterium]